MKNVNFLGKFRSAESAAPKFEETLELPLLPVGGLTPFTTIDYPGKLAAVVFTQGCPWKCAYCYNAELIPFCRDCSPESNESILEFLLHRRKSLDAVVFSGGEPTAHEALSDWIKQMKAWGYLVGLHTSGAYPERLAKVAPLCDWIGMDIKADFLQYSKITGVPRSGQSAMKSAVHVLTSGADYEFRTTVHPELLSEDEVLHIACELSLLGVKKYVIQRFRPSPGTNQGLNARGVRSEVLTPAAEAALRRLLPELEIR